MTAPTSAFASAAGITEDLGITKGISSLLGALFFLGYFFFQIPGAIYAERRSVRKLIFICLILWGGCASLTGVVHNIPALAAIRFILGVVEAAVMPAMLIYISNWFTKSERSRANTFLILGNPVTVLWMSVVSGYLIRAFGWREMFIIEGIPAVIWAFCWWVLVKDKPSQVNWLAESEKSGAAGTTGARTAGASKRYVTMAKPSVHATWCCCVCNISPGASACTVSYCGCRQSSAAAAKNMGMVEVGWLSSVPYLAATIAMIAVSRASDKMQNRKLFVWPLLLIGGLAFIGSPGRRRQPFLGLLYPAGDRRRGHVRPVWPVLCDYPGDAATQRRRRRDGAYQQYGERWVLSLVRGSSAISTAQPAARPPRTFLWVWRFFASVWLTFNC